MISQNLCPSSQYLGWLVCFLISTIMVDYQALSQTPSSFQFSKCDITKMPSIPVFWVYMPSMEWPYISIFSGLIHVWRAFSPCSIVQPTFILLIQCESMIYWQPMQVVYSCEFIMICEWVIACSPAQLLPHFKHAL